jgi:hypothetical protein
MKDELFTIPESHPPRIVELRRRYAEAQAAYDAAEAHEDESGEAIPREIKWAVQNTFRELQREEKREITAP